MGYNRIRGKQEARTSALALAFLLFGMGLCPWHLLAGVGGQPVNPPGCAATKQKAQSEH